MTTETKPMLDAQAKLAVIIPFYQRESGILARALRSVSTQRDVDLTKLYVIIVDDESPVSGEDELASFNDANDVEVRLLQQSNRGPAGARNLALDHLDEDTGFVAFLDSDDQWHPEHLRNSLMALGEEYDFYFSDFYHLNQAVSAFSRAKRIRTNEHPTIRGIEHLHRYTGDMVDQIITGNIIGTSTVVFRFPVCSRLRFREEFVNAGEDYLFWLDLVTKSDRIVFSSKCECTYGAGVNIYSGAKWGTEQALNRIRYELKYRKAIAAEFNLNDAQAAFIRQSLHKSRMEFARELIHRLRHRKNITANQLIKHWQTDPLSIALLPWSAIRLLFSRS